MSIAQVLLPEFDHEMKTTRTVLERIPGAKASFRPHPKSFAMGELGSHLANLPVWATMTLTQAEFDTAPPGKAPLKGPGFVCDVPLPPVYGPTADA